MNAIEIRDLSFEYNSEQSILNNISLSVPKASIFGFLGPNGVGKTTTLKLILSLLRNRSHGTIEVLGNNISNAYPNYLKHIGSLIEEASVYDHLTARENLIIWSRYYGIGAERIEEVLQLIDLEKANRKKVKDYSTGMKQRLGLGIAMLHDPDILILDEPTNGLDPIGINNLRSLLLKLKNQGKTILLSSHILSEVERLVDQVGIINNGTIVYQGTLDTLKEVTQKNIELTVSIDQPAKAHELLQQQYSCKLYNSVLKIIIKHTTEINSIAQQLIQNDIQLQQIIQPKMSLENIFLKLTSSQNLENEI